MYKLIIVDDEEEVRKGIINKLEWARYNFEVAGEAENGREALDIIEENVPDVVITDISMPIMDGLELASLIKESFPTVITVILTGYDDFKFAQQAIKFGVADYILKPVLPKDMEELMLKLKSRIDDEITQKEDIKKLRYHYNESLPVIRENFLTSMIAGKLSQGEIEQRIHSLDLHLKGSKFAAAAANIDRTSIKGTMFDETDFELAKFAVLNISQEIAGKNSSCEAFRSGDNIIITSGFERIYGSLSLQEFHSILEEIRQNIEKYLKITVTIGVGSTVDTLADLFRSYNGAVSALDYKLVTGSNKIIFIEDFEQKIPDSVIPDETKMENLIYEIKFGSEKDVAKAVDSLFSDIAGIKAPFRDLRIYFIGMLASISRLARNIRLDASASTSTVSDLCSELFSFDSLEDIKSWIKAICVNLADSISSSRQNTTKVLLEKAREHINQNYSDNELSIQKVADHLHISSSYLSLIFKKEADETFLKYLVRIRLDRAKELLKNTDMKTTEIAEKIGYPDINYFSYFFKRNFGMSPREYRNNKLPKGVL